MVLTISSVSSSSVVFPGYKIEYQFMLFVR